MRDFSIECGDARIVKAGGILYTAQAVFFPESGGAAQGTSAPSPREDPARGAGEKEIHMAANPMVLLETTSGDILVELFQDKAPLTVANFLDYVDSGFYKNTIFHRVIQGFMIQGGGYTVRREEKKTRPPVKNEADNGLSNVRGTLAMARTAVPDSATAQFFINLVDNEFLDHTAPTVQGWGYAVFGKVVEGMDTVDKIAKIRTKVEGIHENMPVDTVVITGAGRFE